MSPSANQATECMPSRPASLIEAEPRVIVKRGRARPLFARHPWLFAGSIERVEGSPTDGADLAVYSHQGEFIARGLFNSHSQIQVRLYSWDESRPLDQAFWRERLVRAIELRRDVLQLADPAGARRLVYSESDGLSGLVVDQYGPWLVVQLTSLALARRLDLLVSLLVELCQPRGIYLRTERGIREAEGLDLTDRPLWGEVPTAAVAIVENGLEFEVDLVTGQKTGFYLDQRDNRRIVASYARGRRVLDVFCYTGGFSLAAARAGAAEVFGIDVSRAAIEMAQRNAARNQLSNVRLQVGDAFDSMHQLAGNGSQPDGFGMVIWTRRNSPVTPVPPKTPCAAIGEPTCWRSNCLSRTASW